MGLCKFQLYQVIISCSTYCLVEAIRVAWVCASLNSIKSSSSPVLAALSDQLWPHRSVQVSTLSSCHQLQYLLPRRTEVPSNEADDDLIFKINKAKFQIKNQNKLKMLPFVERLLWIEFADSFFFNLLFGCSWILAIFEWRASLANFNHSFLSVFDQRVTSSIVKRLGP